MSRYKDFDAFFKEKGKTPLVLTLFNKKWMLPPALPAGLMLKIIKNKDKTVTENDPQIAFDMFEDLMGKKQFQEMLKLGLDFDHMTAILDWVLEEYNGKPAEVTENPEDSETP